MKHFKKGERIQRHKISRIIPHGTENKEHNMIIKFRRPGKVRHQRRRRSGEDWRSMDFERKIEGLGTNIQLELISVVGSKQKVAVVDIVILEGIN